jgi:hypothetical protein
MNAKHTPTDALYSFVLGGWIVVRGDTYLGPFVTEAVALERAALAKVDA